MPDPLIREIPYLRRYARALTGSQARGDAYVRASLEALLADGDRQELERNPRQALFALFHQVLKRLQPPQLSLGDIESAEAVRGEERAVKRQLSALPQSARQVYLLHRLERFGLAEIAAVLAIAEAEVRRLLQEAETGVLEPEPAEVLIVEDDALVSLHNAQIVQEMGHGVAGIAASEAEAERLAAEAKVDLVLADIRLGDGGSGVEAARRILARSRAPVIFVTAHPGDLLTGDGIEPVFVVEKPFEPEELKAAIAQALSFARTTVPV